MSIRNSNGEPWCPGVFTAETLLLVGLSHDFTILTLCEEVGLSPEEAQRAWDTARSRQDEVRRCGRSSRR